jgi:hypothetical protein
MNRGVGTGAAQNGQGFAHRHAGHETTVGVPERDPRLPGRQRRLENDNAPGQTNRPDPSHLDHGDTVPPTADNRGLSDRGVTFSAQPAHPGASGAGSPQLAGAVHGGHPMVQAPAPNVPLLWAVLQHIDEQPLSWAQSARAARGLFGDMHCFAGHAVRISGHRFS